MSGPEAEQGARIAALDREARALLQAGRVEAAARLCREILDTGVEHEAIQRLAGLVALRQGDFAAAVERYRAAIALRPDHAGAQFNLGNALRELGRLEEAAEAYGRAAAVRPGEAQIHHAHGVTLQALGQPGEAAAAYARVVELTPGSAGGYRNLGLAHHEAGRPEEAATAYRGGLALEPDWPLLHSNLANLLMERGEMAALAAACDAWLATQPGEIEALSLKALALNELGEGEAAGELLDYDRLVMTVRHEAPEGYADLAAFNRALTGHIAAHPTLKVPPADHPTYHNPQLKITEEILGGPVGPVADCERMARAAIEGYRERVSGGAPHPFIDNWPQRWQLSSWGTMLEGEGNLVPHIHLEGYVGGVYYPELPEAFGEPGLGEAGWFELGRPPDDLGCRAAPELRTIRPEAGLMILFPSYLYHRTIPFEAPGRRVSVAFDMVPES